MQIPTAPLTGKMSEQDVVEQMVIRYAENYKQKSLEVVKKCKK